ncbi:MAG: adenylate/guanylate cyclase domain-containing protein [Pseudomonadota bacterium]
MARLTGFHALKAPALRATLPAMSENPLPTADPVRQIPEGTGTSWPKKIAGLLTRIVRAGTDGYPPQVRRRLMVTNITGYLATLSSLSYAVTYALHNFAALKWIVIVNLLSAAITASMPFVHRFGSAAGGIVLAVTIFTTIFYFSYVLGREAGIHLNYFGTAAVAFVIFGLSRLPLIIAVVLSGLVFHLTAQFYFVAGAAADQVEPWFVPQTYLFSASSIMAIIAIVVWYSFRMAADAEERSERLLRNVLPDAVAEQLKERPGEMIAERYDEVTVLFADLVGFTRLARTMDASEIVGLLNAIFVRFDAAAERAGVEKIKTIGDAYMAVGGLPERQPDHAERIARLALDMQAAIQDVARARDADLNIRIGIATGPVAAGVIGQAKFAYDVWGDTVNLAARLESHGEAGRIHVSGQTRDRLDGVFDFEKRPEIDIKGVGSTQTWFLTGSLH